MTIGHRTAAALACALVVLTVAGHAQAPVPARLDIKVAETMGIRRGTFPVGIQVKFRAGVLASASNTRLLLAGKEVAAQFGAASSYPDGSVQSLSVDFNVTVGPREQAAYVLEYGPGVQAAVVPTGLKVTQDAEGVQVGNVRFTASGAPLVQ